MSFMVAKTCHSEGPNLAATAGLVSIVVAYGMPVLLTKSIGGPEGLRSLTNPKVIVVDKYPWLIETSIPVALDYPVRSLVQSWYVLLISPGKAGLSSPFVG